MEKSRSITLTENEVMPCKCGGLPHIAHHYDEKYDEILYFVRCQKCYKNSSFELSEDKAWKNWGTSQKS